MQEYIPEVLIVEEEVELAEVLKDSIDPSMRVTCFSDPEEVALRVESGFWPDVIVLDWSLKAKRGLNFLKEIRQINMDVPIILLSGGEEGSMFHDAARFGISGYFLKPFKFAEFDLAVKKSVLHSRLNRINDHLVRLLGDIVLGFQMKQDHVAQNENDERLEAMAILSAEANWFIQYREQTIKEIAGVLI